MLKDKIKALVQKQTGMDNKRKIESLVVFVIILIITIIMINVILKENNTKKDETSTDPNKKLAVEEEKTVTTANVSTKSELTLQLEEILSKIQGVGKVKVLVTYSQTSQTVPMYNEDTSQKDTQETDTSGGTRKVIETDVKKDVIYQETNGEKTPITQSIVSPKVEGAIITAEGANDANTKANIIQAVEAVTGISSHKIQVFAMEN